MEMGALSTALQSAGLQINITTPTLGSVCKNFAVPEFRLIADLPVDFEQAAFRKWTFGTFCKALRQVLQQRLENGKLGDRASHLTLANTHGILALVIWQRQSALGLHPDQFDGLYSRLVDIVSAYETLRPLRLLQRVIDEL